MPDEIRRAVEAELALRAKRGDKAALAELRRRGYFLRLKEEGRTAPLSRAQLRLWVLERLGADGNAYNLPALYKINRELDAAALEKAFAWLSARHGQLRAHFTEEDGAPRQIVTPAATFAPPFAVHEADTFDSALAAARAFAAEGFTLSRPPLWRAGLWRAGNTNANANADADAAGLFAWVFHHALADEWSLDLLAGELAQAYAAYAAGDEPDLPAPAISYFDWTQREAEYVGGPAGEADREWWLHEWSPPPEALELPTDSPRPAERSFAGAVTSIDWDENLAEGLAGLARREGATPFALAMALTRVFLFRLTGQDDVVVGFPHANRDAAGADSVAGFMANTLALRRRLDAAAPFAANLRRESELLRNALPRAGYPFDSLVEHAARPRDPSRSPVFDVMATLRPAEGGAEMSGFTPINSGYAKARFDAVFEWKEAAGGGLTGLDLTYATSLFGPERAGEWLAAITTMAREVIANPDLPAAELPLLDESGRSAAAAAARGESVALPWEATGQPPLAWLWRESVAAHPEGPAVEDGDGVWTYRELDAASGRIAGALRRAGCGPGDRVAVVLPRSRHLAAALWGIWRVGGAYVPVEADWPEARRKFVITNSGAAFVFADAEANVTDAGGAVRLDPAAALTSDPDETTPDEWAPADGLAYIIYTSGSTGTPKGVAVPPRGVVNMACAQAAAFGVGPQDRALALASTAFDASIAEMLVGWARAACVVMAPPGIAADVTVLAGWLPAAGVTIATVTPALLAILPASALAGVKTLLTAGEAARGGDLAPLLGRTRVFNAYGPTECSVCATLHRVTPGDCAGAAGVPIGFPIPNVDAFVLDAAGQPTLPDTAGDLWLGGMGLAHGYWNRPDLTRDAFRESALAGGGVLYRTGDRARRRRDGELLFLGRRDGQVKVRGQRVEAREVEHALSDALPGRGSAVLAHKAGGETELVAMLAGGGDAAGDADADIARARKILAERLPAAMRPGRYVTVAELPRDASGKVDRRALASLLARLDTEAGPGQGREPERRHEREVLEAWREALGHGRLGLTDNFFLAGGHSLSVLRAAALTAERTGRTVTAKDIFSHPTAEGLAEELAARDEEPAAEAATPATPAAATAAKRSHPSAGSVASGLSAEALDARIRRGELPALDAAALGYFPDAPPAGLDPSLWTRPRVLGDWCGGRATLLHVYDTPFGRTGLITLPLFHTDLFGNSAQVITRIGEGLTIAKSCGAAVVSLTGMLPSVTSGGRAVAENFPPPEWPAVTHGHASTAAALLAGAQKLLATAGRDWSGVTAGFLGLGSVGSLTARLWMNCRPLPRRVILADVPSKRAELEALAAEWRERARSTRCEMKVDILAPPASPPDEWYDADLMLCAVGAGEVVDVTRLRPGTLLADDSAPPCFSWEKAGERMRLHKDILAIESGDLALPEPWTRSSYRPDGLREYLPEDDTPCPADARRMTSCVLSGLLLARGLAACPHTLGAVDTAAATAHWRGLAGLGVTAPDFRCGGMRPDGIDLKF